MLSSIAGTTDRDGGDHTIGAVLVVGAASWSAAERHCRWTALLNPHASPHARAADLVGG